jgi:uncharacterized protein (DUF1800 family)
MNYHENYARELMELHTLGVDGGYTQEDIISLAKIFTGWELTSGRQQGDSSGFYFDIAVLNDSQQMSLKNLYNGLQS